MLRVGIAGYGVVGRRRHQCIDKHPNMDLISTCDIRQDIADFSDFKDMMDNSSLDALFVCLPNYLSPDVTSEAIARGIHVFCEKPPACNVEGMEKVLKQKSLHPELKLKYGFNHRYHPSIKDALELIKSGQMGSIINLRGVYGKSKIIPVVGDEEIDILSGWRSHRKYAGGGILLDQGIHLLDLMRLFCGEFCRVKSFISNDYWNHDIEDNAYVIMKSLTGEVAMLHSSATQWQHKFSLDIALTDGYVCLNGILSGSKSYGQETMETGYRSQATVGTLKGQKTIYLEDNSWQEEVDEFADAILNDSSIVHGTGEDALGLMKLIETIYKSDEEWRKEFYVG